MTNPPNDPFFDLPAWKAALGKYASAARLTIKLFGSGGQAILGPIHSTPLFRLFEEAGYEPCIFTECARRCLAQDADCERAPVIVNHVRGLTVFGTSLVLGDRVVGAVVAGYAFADFSEVSEMQYLAREAGIDFERLWEVARKQKPTPQSRLTMDGELLQVLGDTLLRENYRTRQNAVTAAIVECSDDAIISKDLNGVIMSWNPGAERLFGYTAREAVGQPITILFPADRLDEEPAILERLRKGKRVDHFETVRQHKDGTLLDISLTIWPIRDSQGNIVGASKIAHDVTQHKRAEAALHASQEAIAKSEERFRTLADNMAQLAWMADPSGWVFWYNQRWLDYTGTTLEEMQGWGWRKVQHPDHVDRVVRGVQHSWDTGEAWEDTFPLRGADGDYRWFLSRAVPIRGSGGEILRWFGTNTDITEQRENQERLSRVEKLAAAGQLAASMAHEINNPLSSVTNALYLLEKDADLDASSRDLASLAATELARVSRIVKQSLSYYRVGSVAHDLDLAELVSESLLIFREKFERAGIRLKLDLNDGTPVPGFADEIRQVIDNLLSNALEAMSKGGHLTVSVRKSFDWKRRDRKGVRLTIVDSGYGIPRKVRAKIFEPFFTTKQEKGNGLGLWVLQGIVSKHEGTLNVRSSDSTGKSGTLVTVFLPSDPQGLRRLKSTRSEPAA